MPPCANVKPFFMMYGSFFKLTCFHQPYFFLFAISICALNLWQMENTPINQFLSLMVAICHSWIICLPGLTFKNQTFYMSVWNVRFFSHAFTPLWWPITNELSPCLKLYFQYLALAFALAMGVADMGHTLDVIPALSVSLLSVPRTFYNCLIHF